MNLTVFPASRAEAAPEPAAAGPRRVLLVSPLHPALAPGPVQEAAHALFRAARARPGLAAQFLAAIPPGFAGLSRPEGAVFAGPGAALSGTFPADDGETLMIAPNCDLRTGLQRSWYLATRLREFLAARAFDAVWIFQGGRPSGPPHVGLDFPAIARAACPAADIGCVFVAGEPAPAPEEAAGEEAALIGGIVFAERARAYSRFVLLAGPGGGVPGPALPALPPLPPGARVTFADAAACLDLIAGKPGA